MFSAFLWPTFFFSDDFGFSALSFLASSDLLLTMLFFLALGISVLGSFFLNFPSLFLKNKSFIVLQENHVFVWYSKKDIKKLSDLNCKIIVYLNVTTDADYFFL